MTHSRPDATREAPAVIAVSINWQLARDRPGRVGPRSVKKGEFGTYETRTQRPVQWSSSYRPFDRFPAEGLVSVKGHGQTDLAVARLPCTRPFVGHWQTRSPSNAACARTDENVPFIVKLRLFGEVERLCRAEWHSQKHQEDRTWYFRRPLRR
jgi:hypothetical protein